MKATFLPSLCQEVILRALPLEAPHPPTRPPSPSELSSRKYILLETKKFTLNLRPSPTLIPVGGGNIQDKPPDFHFCFMVTCPVPLNPTGQPCPKLSLLGPPAAHIRSCHSSCARDWGSQRVRDPQPSPFPFPLVQLPLPSPPPCCHHRKSRVVVPKEMALAQKAGDRQAFTPLET